MNIKTQVRRADAVIRGTLHLGLCLTAGSEGCAGGGDAAAVGKLIPPVWLSAYSGVPGTRGIEHECGAGVSSMAAERLQIPRRHPRKRVAKHWHRPLPATDRNHLWAYDFVFDAYANGQHLKCLIVIVEYTRECLAMDVVSSIRSGRVIKVLSRLISLRGVPCYLRSDNYGPEFLARAVLRWLLVNGITMALIDPGKPWQNGLDESLNGNFRDECLGPEWFRTRAEVKIIIELWRQHYNHVRPHHSLDCLTPYEFMTRDLTTAITGAVLQ